MDLFSLSQQTPLAMNETRAVQENQSKGQGRDASAMHRRQKGVSSALVDTKVAVTVACVLGEIQLELWCGCHLLWV